MKVGKSAAGHKRDQHSEPEQLPQFKKRGGKRRGAGRKPTGKRAGSSHKARPELKARHPVHVVLRVVDAVHNLRRRFTYHAIREATLTTARRDDFRIVHLSIQRTHLHLLVEADPQACADGREAGVSDLGRQAPQRGDQQGKSGPAAPRARVRGSLLRRGDHVARPRRATR